MQAADGTLEQPLNGAARRVQQQERLPAMCDVWRLVGLVVMFFAVNTVVRQFDDYEGPLRYLSFGPYDDDRGNRSQSRTYNGVTTPGPKRGFGGQSSSPHDLRLLSALPWWYNWGAGIPGGLAGVANAHGMEFVPMQWNDWGMEDLDDNIQALKTAGVKVSAVLGFNEPNHQEQADMSPRFAADVWPQLEAAATKYGLRIGAPSAAGCGGASCITATAEEWLDKFFLHCVGCRVDFMTAHIYSCDVGAVETMVNDLGARYNRSVWVTELDCPNAGGPVEHELAFMRNVTDFLDASPVVERYAWFTDRWDADPTISLLMPNASALTPTGQAYIGNGSTSIAS